MSATVKSGPSYLAGNGQRFPYVVDPDLAHVVADSHMKPGLCPENS